MIYRKATMEDINELVRLRMEFLNEVQDSDRQNDEQLAKKTFEYLKINMQNDSFISWLALDDNKIVGTSGIYFYTVPPSYKNISGKTAYIMNMYTIPGYRSKGIANELFNSVVKEARDRGCGKITLNATDMGRPLYLKNGFVDSHGDMVYNI